ncbi:hypothetical protein HDE_03345 [Halotydeus destructor]|nr:hypothetical protein HDE_03345 [Halotydeus destructor]
MRIRKSTMTASALQPCLTYRDNRVKQDEVGCKKLPNGATTSIDDCTCILNLIYPYLFRNSTYNGTGPTLTQVHRGVTASEYTPCPGQS